MINRSNSLTIPTLTNMEFLWLDHRRLKQTIRWRSEIGDQVPNNGAVRVAITMLGRFHGCDSVHKYQFWEIVVLCQDQDLNRFWTLNDIQTKLLNHKALKAAMKIQAVNLINWYNFVEGKKYSRSTKIINGSVNNICILCYQPDVESSSTKISIFTGRHWNIF